MKDAFDVAMDEAQQAAIRMIRGFLRERLAASPKELAGQPIDPYVFMGPLVRAVGLVAAATLVPFKGNAEIMHESEEILISYLRSGLRGSSKPIDADGRSIEFREPGHA